MAVVAAATPPEPELVPAEPLEPPEVPPPLPFELLHAATRSAAATVTVTPVVRDHIQRSR